MELLSMDKLKENNKRFILKYLDDTKDIKKTNELIIFFSSQDDNNYGDFILNGRLDELNKILND